MSNIVYENVSFVNRNSVVYTFKIKDFYDYMMNWIPNRSIRLNNFVINENEFYFLLYPNGVNRNNEGSVSLVIVNCSCRVVFFNCKIIIGDIYKSSDYCHLNERGGFLINLCSHDKCNADVSDYNFVINFNIKISPILDVFVCKQSSLKFRCFSLEQQIKELNKKIQYLEGQINEFKQKLYIK